MSYRGILYSGGIRKYIRKLNWSYW